MVTATGCWTDLQLMQEFAAHDDQSALNLLYERRQPDLLRTIGRLLGNEHPDDEACQTIAERVWLRLVAQLRRTCKFDPSRGSLGVYLALLARDAVGTQKVRARRPSGLLTVPPSALHRLPTKRDWTPVDFHRLMDGLTEKDRLLLEEQLSPAGPRGPRSRAREQRVYRL